MGGRGCAGASEPTWCIALLLHGGRTYLTQTVVAQGYSGLPWPACWRGQVMVPIELAFLAQANRAIDQLEPAIAPGLLAMPTMACQQDITR